MMATVLIRLEGPMQSWGLSARGPNGAHRRTEPRPTKSAVVGLVANALGRDFTDSIDDLAALRFGVRVDRAGRTETDYHTAGGGTFPLLPGDAHTHLASAKLAETYTPATGSSAEYVGPSDMHTDASGQVTAKPGLGLITQDWYLADASFLVALTGEDTLIGHIATALTTPARPLFLGRKAYPPAAPLLAGHHDSNDTAGLLETEPRPPRGTGERSLWIEPDPTQPIPAGTHPVHDQPLSFHGAARRGARLETRMETAGFVDQFLRPDPALNPEPLGKR